MTLTRREDLKKNITEGKALHSSLLKDIMNVKEKVGGDESSYSNTLTELLIKLEKLKEKHSEISKKFQENSKNYDKKKMLLKEVQERTNEKKKLNETM